VLPPPVRAQQQPPGRASAPALRPPRKTTVVSKASNPLGPPRQIRSRSGGTLVILLRFFLLEADDSLVTVVWACMERSGKLLIRGICATIPLYDLAFSRRLRLYDARLGSVEMSGKALVCDICATNGRAPTDRHVRSHTPVRRRSTPSGWGHRKTGLGRRSRSGDATLERQAGGEDPRTIQRRCQNRLFCQGR
jgi:hypothetical protein